MIHSRWRLVKSHKTNEQWMICSLCGRSEHHVENTDRCPRHCEQQQNTERSRQERAAKKVRATAQTSLPWD